jgi:divalent metal cation (Fe/Co/Zn/Cd) transporter
MRHDPVDPRQMPTSPPPTARDWRRIGLFLVGATMIYTIAEGVVTLWAGFQAGWTLLMQKRAEESRLGIALAGASLVVMPLMAWGKLHAATAIDSAALRSEAKETLACSYLSLTLFVGLVANALAGWWWADPTAALLMIPWLVKEGLEGLRGEDDEETRFSP